MVSTRLQLGHLAHFLLRLCQQVIVEDLLIIPTPLNKGLALIPNDKFDPGGVG